VSTEELASQGFNGLHEFLGAETEEKGPASTTAWFHHQSRVAETFVFDSGLENRTYI
jgi:hypothetical protein